MYYHYLGYNHGYEIYRPISMKGFNLFVEINSILILVEI
jgi:hypothetical protein